MSIKSNEFQKLTSVLGTDSILMADSAGGTAQLSLEDLARFLTEQENAVKTALSSKADAAPPVWHDLTLTETFVPDGDGDDAANRYCRDQFGRVTVRLMCKTAAEGGISSEYNVARLPVGYRPKEELITSVFRENVSGQAAHADPFAFDAAYLRQQCPQR